ncbi:MAG: tripartite tricarboxylate transporter substrate binding protein [Betaproteobacteria bacterium]|nr:tripartite tricarboxylate transporter substrate binding protein [Betaproteobacteria bacterium]
MRIERKWRIAAAALAVAGSIPATHAAEEAYPNRPLRLIVPYPPGGSTDPTARAYGSWISDKWGVSIVVDNRPGAGSTIGHALGAKATPDGYTLLLGTSGGLVVSPAFGTRLAYDSVKDFAPIGVGVYVPFLLVVHPSVAAKSTQELVELAKAQPGKINFGSPGTGTPNHLGMELLKAMTGAEFTHVPYKGGGPATIDLVAGRIQAIFGSIPQWQPHLATGRVRAVGIGHPTRVKSMPEVQAIAEILPGFNNTSWYGFLAPAGTPAPIINKINAEMNRAASNPEFIKFIEGMGLEIAKSTPQEMGDLIRSELARWTKVIESAGIKQAN